MSDATAARDAARTQRNAGYAAAIQSTQSLWEQLLEFDDELAQTKVSGVVSTLKVAHSINVKETGERYVLTVIERESKLPQSHTVLEVGQDFVVVKDFTGLNETRIPITSVKAVIHFKGFDRK
ncbi:MAG: hypothetical protein U0939_12505 [Pirellulales bacterium]